MRYKIVEKDNILAVHSTGYYGDSGKERAQERINTGDCNKYYIEKNMQFIVIEDNKN